MLSMEDPRGPAGQLSRGTNNYQGASKSPWVGKFTEASTDRMQQATLLPQYKKLSLQDVARSFLTGNENADE